MQFSKEQEKIIKRRLRLGWFLSKSNSPVSARISYAGILILSILFSCFYLQSFFYLITILILSLPVLSYNITAYTVKKLSVAMHLSHDRLTLTFNNPTYIPVSCTDITLELYSYFYGGDEAETHSLSLRSLGSTDLGFPLSLEKYGIYEAHAYNLTIYDPLHMFRFKQDTDIKEAITLMPETDPADKKHEIVYEEGFDEFTDTGRKGNSSSNVTDIREYRPGDRLSRIHWKLTEKLDTLIVKENEATSSNDFIVLLELYQPSAEDCMNDPSLYNILNDAIKEARAVSLELIAAGEPFIFMIYNVRSGDFEKTRVINRDDLNDAMTHAFYAGCYMQKDLALSVYKKSGQDLGTLIHVN